MPLWPLLIPAAAWLAGKAIEHFLEDGSIALDDIKYSHFRVGPSGHGFTVRGNISGEGAKSAAGAHVVVRPKTGESYVQSQHKEYADSDGDLVSICNVVQSTGALSYTIHIPYVAFPDPDAEIDLDVAVVGQSKTVMARGVFRSVKLEGTAHDRRNAMAAMCDAAVAAITSDGELAREHVRAARQTLESAWKLDEFGIDALRRNLKRAASTPSGSEWFSPARLAGDLADEFDVEDRATALGMLYAIAAAAGAVGYRGDSLLLDIAGRLGVDDAPLLDFRQKHTLSVALGVLGLAEGASLDDIKRAYRRLAKEYHPDMVRHMDPKVQKAASVRFDEISRAYEALMNSVLSP
jgi:uncharacterized tellurite resistance protein B-like protein